MAELQQATGNETMQIMLLTTLMDQLMHQDEQAYSPFDLPSNNILTNTENVSLIPIAPASQPTNPTPLYVCKVY